MENHRITDLRQLRALYDPPIQRALDKVVTTFSEPYRRFLARSPFAVIGTQGPDGGDVSPRGDRPGFAEVLDDHTLAIPDRRGNRRLDSLSNVIHNPNVALIFFIPGLNETLRVNGVAHISVEPGLLERLAHSGKLPRVALVVRAREIFHQCVRALRRAEFWDPTSFVGPEFPKISTTPESTYDDKLY